MSNEELILEVQEIAREVFHQSGLMVNESTSVSDVENWSSLSFMHFLSEIENKYYFKFKITELLQLQTIGAIVETISKHIE